VSTYTGIVDVTEDHSLLTAGNNVIKPNEVTLETDLLHTDLGLVADQLYDKDYTITEDEVAVIANCNDKDLDQEASLRLWLLLKKYGYKNISIEARKDNHNSFQLTYSNNMQKNSSNRVKKIEILHENTKQFVYDLSTVTERFHAGVGEIVVHNTDSVFLAPHEDMMGETLGNAEQMVAKIPELAQELLDAIHVEIHAMGRSDKIKMALDKIMYPSVYCGKKKYYGIAWEDGVSSLYISGMESVKRGKTKFLRDVSERIMEQSLDLENESSLLEICDVVLDDVAVAIKREPIESFIRTTKYKSDKVSFINTFIERMRIKEQVNPSLYKVPAAGVNFQYVITVQPNNYYSDGRVRKCSVADRAEFLSVVQTLNRKIDYEYYLDDIVGVLSRFMSGDAFFQDLDIVDDSDQDKHSKKKADTYIRDRIKVIYYGDAMKHTTVKAGRKSIIEKYTTMYGPIIDQLRIIYDTATDFNENASDTLMYKAKTGLFDIAIPDNSIQLTHANKQVNIFEIRLNQLKSNIDYVFNQLVEDLNAVSVRTQDPLMGNYTHIRGGASKYSDELKVWDESMAQYIKWSCIRHALKKNTVSTITTKSEIRAILEELLQ
jgi:hypothetical protein